MALLQDKVILISGGTQGLGAGVARRAAAEGAAGIAVTGRNAESGERLAAEITASGVETRFIKTDLADVEQARNSVLDTISTFGRLDCSVNAAGLTTRGTMLDTTPELFDAHIAVNLKSPFFIMAETIKHLRSRGVPGSILNVISIAELGGQPYLAPYVAAKAGLAGVTRNAAHGTPVGQDPHQRSGHRLDRNRGRSRNPKKIPWRWGGLAGESQRIRPHGKARPSGRDRRIHCLSPLRQERCCHRFSHRLGPERIWRIRLSTITKRLAAAPISWGVCEVPGWGHQLEADRVLSEMTALGISATEFGPAGFLPEQAAQRADV
jgi:NADP-dependent 3-hydroxy acid dehydrogenase YdfG